MQDRLERLRTLLSERQLDAVIVGKPENRQYFSGFTGSAGLLAIASQEAFLVTDFRYVEQASQEAAAFTVIRAESSLVDSLVQVIRRQAWRHLGVEEDYITMGLHRELSERLPHVAWNGLILDGLRMIKDNEEIRLLREAVRIADAAFAHIVRILRPGLSEKAVAAELEYAMRRQGAEKAAFDTIVASGPRSSLPHGLASDKVLAEGDLVTMDFGAVYQGYHSDITRTVVIGRATDKQRQIYNTVAEAQRRASDAIRPGLTGQQVDAIARDYIKAAAFGDFFGHALGHGVGLAIHEEPRLSPTYTHTLQAGMAVTVEPGIYLPGWGGVRIEDLVVLTPSGCEVLTQSPKELLEIGAG